MEGKNGEFQSLTERLKHGIRTQDLNERRGLSRLSPEGLTIITFRLLVLALIAAG